MEVTKEEPYVNEDQRNIHVWAPYKLGKTFLVIAGCYSKDNAVTKNRFYRWLDKILKKHEHKEYVIAKCAEDPREEWPKSWEPYKDQHLKRDDPDHALEIGHYFIFVKKKSSWDSDTAALFKNRFRNRHVLFTPIKAEEAALLPTPTRSHSFREQVRDRDRGCIVTSTVVHSSHRGLNYTGFQAAHLWPLSWFSKLERPEVELVMNKETRRKLQELQGPITPRSSRLPCIDTSKNGVLLSSTLHLSMDAWEWGIDEDSLAVRFERHSAIFLPNTFTHVHPPFNMDMDPVIPNYDDDFRDAHFNLVLLHRVAGTGPIPGTSRI